VAGAAVEHAIVGIGGAHVRGVNSHGGISLGTRPREIGRDEIKQAVERARAIPLPADREVLHLLPQEFILDDQAGVHDPLGMMAARLEVRVHLVTAAASATQNVITAVNRAGVHVDDTVFEPLAAADSVLRADERELGVCLADIGAGSTELIVFLQGAVAYTGVIPVGGDHFTSDLSVGMCTPLAEAEKIKKVYGNAIVTLIPEGNEVEVPSVGDRPSRLLPQRLVAEILEPRARELFEMMRETLRQSGMFDACLAGIVLSGGGSRLPGIFDVAESVLRRPVRLVLAYAAGENAGHAGRARVCHGARHGELRTTGASGARVSGRSVGIEIEGDVGGMKGSRAVSQFHQKLPRRNIRFNQKRQVLLCPSRTLRPLLVDGLKAGKPRCVDRREFKRK
jgi:cell division protein FtsA